MKKKLFMLMVLIGNAVAMQAYEYSYLTFQTNDGALTSLSVESIKLSVSDGKLVASDSNGNYSFLLTDLSKMYFSTSAAGLAQIEADGSGDVEVFGLTGVSLGRFPSTDAARESLSSGIYVIKGKNKTSKLVVR